VLCGRNADGGIVGRGMVVIASVALLAASVPQTPAASNLLAPVLQAIAHKVCGICYVLADGKPPSGAVARRLAGVQGVSPLPTSGVPADERGGASVIDLFKAHLTSRERGEVSAEVSKDMGSGLIAVESCTYHLARTSGGWELRPEETRCLVM
jgi:hypothetical protein